MVFLIILGILLFIGLLLNFVAYIIDLKRSATSFKRKYMLLGAGMLLFCRNNKTFTKEQFIQEWKTSNKDFNEIIEMAKDCGWVTEQETGNYTSLRYRK